MALWRIWNGPAPTTAQQLAVTTGTAIETVIQVLSATGIALRVKAWGFSMDGAAAAPGVEWELLETGVIAATVTAHSASGIVAIDSAALLATPSAYFNLGTSATGFTASVEGAIVESRVFDGAFVQPTGERAWEFSLGNGREIDPIHVLRLRVTAAAAVLAKSWVEIES